jgi:hypothetical protein
MKFLINLKKYYPTNRDSALWIFTSDIPFIRNKYHRFLRKDLFTYHFELDRLIRKFRDEDNIYTIIKHNLKESK